AGGSFRAAARFSAEHFVKAAQHEGITVFNAPPAAYWRLVRVARTTGADLPKTRLRILGVGSAPLDESLKEEAETILGLPLRNGYGITEMGPSIAFVRPTSLAPGGSVGPPLP